MTRVLNFLWFGEGAEEAAEFYVSLVPDSRIDDVRRRPPHVPGGPEGSVMAVDFTLGGIPYVALNGGPHYTLNPAFSIFIECADQAEIDRIWDALADGGTPMQCGWITDRFGLTWQVVPKELGEMLVDEDAERASRVFNAMLGMVRLDVAGLKAAYAG